MYSAPSHKKRNLIMSETKQKNQKSMDIGDHSYCSSVNDGEKASKSHRNCCVPYCVKSGYYHADQHGKVSYFKFPLDNELRKKWIVKIKRDVGDFFQITSNTFVCSLHFKDSDFREVSQFSGRRYLNPTAVPTVFKCWEGLKVSKTPVERLPNRYIQLRSSALAKSSEEATVTHNPKEATVTHDSADLTDSSFLEPVAASSVMEEPNIFENSRILTEQEYQTLQEKIEMLEVENIKLKEKSAYLEKQLRSKFSIDSLEKDTDVCFYTGFPNKKTFFSLLKFLNPGDCGENIIRYGSNATSNNDSGTTLRQGRPVILTTRDQFFLFLCRVRLGLLEHDLAFRFGISDSTVSYIIITWANFMYLRLGSLPIWPQKEIILQTMPPSFKEKYPNTRVIIDATEIKCEMPSSLVLKSKSYSNYKSSNTLKGLIGITPAGNLSFVSQLYTGSISDKELTERSGLLLKSFDKGDSIMADKGFDIQELLDPLGLSLNIPPFLEKQDQMTAEDVTKTQSIAAERIHVERLINKVKNFHIFDQVIPLTLFGSINQIWTSCALLTLFQNPIISVPQETSESERDND